MKLLCFSDIHSCVEAVSALIADTGARHVSYDAVILAGGITDLVVTKDIGEAQQHSNIVYAGRFDRAAVISKDALLHISGHTHTGVRTRNYLNTGFLYRDGSNGAEPMMGGYFDADINGRAVEVEFHAPGPVKRAPLKSAGFGGDVYAPHGRAFPVKLATG